jgi:hypothetical protein
MAYKLKVKPDFTKEINVIIKNNTLCIEDKTKGGYLQLNVKTWDEVMDGIESMLRDLI